MWRIYGNFRHISGTFLLILVVFGVKSQSPPLYHYGVEQGLPTLFLYDLEIDKSGYLWIAGESGLLKFDGINFIPDPAGKLQSAEALRLHKAPDNAMWFLDLKGNICIYKDEVLTVVDSIDASADFQQIHFALNRFGDQLILEKDAYNLYWVSPGAETLNLKKYKSIDQVPIGQAIAGFDRSFAIHARKDLVLIDKDKRSVYKTPAENPSGKSRIAIWKDKYLLNAGNKLYTFDQEKEIFAPVFEEFAHFWRQQILGIYLDSNENIWVSSENGIIRLFEEEGKWKHQHLLKGIIAGDIVEDWQGNIWFSTKQNGLYFLSDNALDLKFFEVSDLSINSLETDHLRNIYLGYEGGLVEKRNASFDLMESLQIESGNSRIYDLEKSDFHNGLFVAGKNLYFLNNKFKPEIEINLSSCKAIEIAEDKSIWFGASMGAGTVNGQAGYKLNTRSYAIRPLDKHTAYAGTLKGLVKIKKNSIDNINHVAGLKNDIRTINVDKYNKLWVGTQDDGIYILENDQIKDHITTANGLGNNKCSKIELDENYAWVLNPKSLTRINIDDYEDINIIGKSRGLNAFALYDFTLGNEEVLVAANDGVYSLPKNKSFLKDSIRIFVEQITVNNQNQPLKDIININGEDNSLQVAIGVISFLNAKQLQYASQLVGVQKEWNTAQDKYINYSGLKAGNYLLQWKVRIPGQDWIEGKTINVVVKPLFVETIQAKALAILLAISSGFLFYWLFNKSKIQRRKLRDQLNQAQIMSVRARMNPHFVFNALNSIQDFILQANTRDANRYLGRFSKLMRNVLFASEQTYISLEKELETLDLYLSLEQLRFETEFEFSINIAPNINVVEIKIPSMMIQPHVENAIKHGLLHKHGLKRLEINIKSAPDQLLVEIIDNGVGRAAAKEIQKNSRLKNTGKGMELSEKQLRLINNFNEKFHSIMVEDLKNEKDETNGTKVTLTLSLSSFQKIVQYEKNELNA